ncbi:uncharacterized protein LOC110931551 [Helianthus annuus]|uniref:uncharacterized protein LOC110931551 n=1 Tax=Helianthus annuus TaxID=4232 RepID=UPI000B9012B1|nr:uncharacterized protein LOC110931551 [Helianthus annuus]
MVLERFGAEVFTVKDVRKSLSSALDLNVTADDFVWNSWATSKSIMFVWRAIVDKIPLAVDLKYRGVNLLDVTCKICGAVDETADHILLKCNFATRVWEMVTNWVNIPMVNTNGNVKDLLKDLNEIHRNGKMMKHRLTLRLICGVISSVGSISFLARRNDLDTAKQQHR